MQIIDFLTFRDTDHHLEHHFIYLLTIDIENCSLNGKTCGTVFFGMHKVYHLTANTVACSGVKVELSLVEKMMVVIGRILVLDVRDGICETGPYRYIGYITPYPCRFNALCLHYGTCKGLGIFFGKTGSEFNLVCNHSINILFTGIPLRPTNG